MSNRLLWILIILSFIWFWYFYYKYEYLPSIEKEKNIELENKVETKKVWLKEVLVEKNNISWKEKIEEIKEKQDNYRSFNIDNNLVSFKENNLKLDLYIWEKFIWDFEKVDKSKIDLQKIYSTENDLFITIWTKKYIYNYIIWKINEFTLNIEINYIKNSENKYLINTEKGTFIYDFYKKEINYFSLFNDFIFYEDSVIWLIKSEEDTIKNNFWFSEFNDNLIISYNQSTKEKKVILNSEIELNKIYLKENKIYFEDIEGNIFELENY